MALQTAARADAPMTAINTTPLIDVLLVLLIMLVITVPVATNQMDFDLPSQGTKGSI
jgi:biopolymer transport protein ExbD